MALPPVTLQRQFANCVTTAELLGRETALIEHYRHVVALAERYGNATSLQPFPYFRTKPAIIAGADVITRFDWNDDVDETRTVLQALVDAGAGEDRLEHLDVDQGWEIFIVAKASTTCWIEWDAEGPPPETGGYAIDRVEAACQAAVAMVRMRVIHERLVEALGRDYWTYHPVDRALPPDESRIELVSTRSSGIWRAALAFLRR